MELGCVCENFARIQYIVGISLVAHFKEDELKNALLMISEMAGTIDTAIFQDAIFRQSD